MLTNSTNSENLIPNIGLELTTRYPANVFFRKCKLNEVGFFKGLAKVSASLGTGQIWSLHGGVIEAIEAIKVEDLGVAERAWFLIYRAMFRGAAELVAPSVQLLNIAEETDQSLSIHIDSLLMDKEVVINRKFLVRPHDLPILADFQALLQQWLIDWGLEESRAQTVAARLPIFFVHGLHKEWSERSHDYAPVEVALQTPFIAANENLVAWEYYYSSLQKKVQEAMFQETFSLSQVYVPLRGYYEEKVKALPSEKDLPVIEYSIRVIVDLETALNQWVNKADRSDTLRIVSGGPGSGKSSFARMWATELTRRTDLHILFIELHRLDLKSTLEESVGQFIRQSQILPYNPLDAERKEKRLLVIFDGLDEIAELGRVSKELASNFVSLVEKTLSNLNYESCRVQAVVAGRELVIQTSVKHHKEGRVLNVLPFKEKTLNGDKGDGQLLEVDQRDLWWKKYGQATGKGYEALPDQLKQISNDADEQLYEVTIQPLLNYLVALSFDRGQVDFSQDISLNQIYADLIENVHSGVHNENRGHVPDLNPQEFLQVLEEVGLAVWHGNGRTATVAQIEGHCKKGGTEKLLAKFQEKAKTDVTQLLVAFYFREQGNDHAGNRTFEFTHKSFGEYLTAKRIVSELEFIHEELERSQTRLRGGYTMQDALISWAEVCGPTAIDNYLLSFLAREIALKGQRQKETIRKWQLMLCTFLEFTTQESFPMEQMKEPLTFQEMRRWARNAEEALLAVLSCCAKATGEISKIQWSSETAIGELISRLQGQRRNASNFIGFNSLNHLDLRGAILYFKDLYGTNLTGANLSKANLTEANLSKANLTEANLSKANLTEANLSKANLSKANLTGANLSKAHLTGANLTEANLTEADLSEANLSYANLSEVNLSEANLLGANLSRATLLGANLSYANLSEVNLTGTYLPAMAKNGLSEDFSKSVSKPPTR